MLSSATSTFSLTRKCAVGSRSTLTGQHILRHGIHSTCSSHTLLCRHLLAHAPLSCSHKLWMHIAVVLFSLNLQLYITGDLVGGLDIVNEMAASGELLKAVSQVVPRS